MNKEELIGKLQMVYVGDKNALNELIGYYDGLKQGIEELQQENKQLKDNWNMLKEHLKNRYDNGTESISYRQVFMEIREAMQVLEIAQELEKGDSNV